MSEIKCTECNFDFHNPDNTSYCSDCDVSKRDKKDKINFQDILDIEIGKLKEGI